MHLRPDKKLLLVIALAVIVAVPAAYWALTMLAADPAEACNGIPRRVGGCDRDQPRFTATTCAGAGEQFGTEVDRRALAIIDGPPSPVDSHASRIMLMTFLVAARAEQHLIASGLRGECSVDEFMAGAESRFSPDLKARVGDFLYDAPAGSYTYEDWLASLRRTVAIIED